MLKERDREIVIDGYQVIQRHGGNKGSDQIGGGGCGCHGSNVGLIETEMVTVTVEISLLVGTIANVGPKIDL